MLRLRVISLLLILFTFCVSSIDAAEPDGQQYVERIRNAGFEVTRASVEKHLRRLVPNEEILARVSQLIKQLDSESFDDRQDASKQLGTMPVLPLEAVREAALHGSSETRLRARRILDKHRTSQGTRSSTLYSMFKAIQYGRIDVSLVTIMESVPHCNRRFVVAAALAAAKKVCKPTDEAMLREHLAHSVPSLRGVACEVLGNLMQSRGKPTDPAIVAMLADDDERARVFAARAVANAGDRRCMSVLVGLLHAESQDVRATAAHALRSATGQRFSYAAYEDRKNRDGAVSRWRQWLKEHGDAAKLNFPLKANKHQWGRILVCLSDTGRLVEFNSSRKIIWNKEELSYPSACIGTQFGERIVVHSKRFNTYDAAGQEVGQSKRLLSGPSCLARTPEGNLVIGTHRIVATQSGARKEGGQIVEIGSDGKTVRQFEFLGDAPRDVHLLPNGNVLIPVRSIGKVVECDREGKEIWKISRLHFPHSARRLSNGNTLVSIYLDHRVVEFDRNKKEVWSATVTKNPVRAIALENGNILVGHSKGVSEINRKGKEVWSKQLGKVTDIARY